MTWFYAHGGELDPKTGNVSTRASLKGADDAILVAIEEARTGVFQPNRENDELTRALGNPEHPGRTQGKGALPWYEGFSDWNTDYRTRAGKKIADKFVRQCGVLVKDQLPISLQEWRKPAKPRPNVTFVDENQKNCFGILSWNISPYQIISQKQMCRKSRTLLLGRWRLHSRTTRIVNGTSTSREEGRLQYSREH